MGIVGIVEQVAQLDLGLDDLPVVHIEERLHQSIELLLERRHLRLVVEEHGSGDQPLP